MVDAALPREVLPVVSVNIFYWWSLSCDHGLHYASWCEKTTTTTTATTTTKLLLLKLGIWKQRTRYISSTIIITDYLLLYHRLQYTDYYYYTLLLCHRLVRHALTRFRKKNCPGIQNPNSSPRFSDVFLTSRTLYAGTTRYKGRIRKALDSALRTKWFDREIVLHCPHWATWSLNDSVAQWVVLHNMLNYQNNHSQCRQRARLKNTYMKSVRIELTTHSTTHCHVTQ